MSGQSKVDELREDLVMRLHLTNDECPPGTGHGWRAVAEAKVDALIKAVSDRQKERDAEIESAISPPVFMSDDPRHQPGSAYYDGYMAGVSDFAQAIRTQEDK